MSGGVKLGRADVTDCLGSLSFTSGDSLEVGGWFSGADLETAFGLRQQLLGLGDEPIVPVVSTLDPRLDGFYIPEGVRVEADHDFSYDTRAEMIGAHRWSATLRRISGGYAHPAFDTLVATSLRANSSTVTTPVGILAAYYTPTVSAQAEIDLSRLPTVTSTALTTEDGPLVVGTAAGPMAWATWRQAQSPADFFVGGARIEVKFGTTWMAVVGRQIPAGIGANWRLSNGYCRVYPSATGAGGKKGFTVETFRAGVWKGQEFADHRYNASLASYNGPNDVTGDATGYSDPIIITNRIDVCVVRVAGSTGIHTFTIRKGDTWVEVTTGAKGLPVHSFGYGRTTAEAGTLFTGGIAATASDANGLRYLICAGFPSNRDGGVGRMTSTVNKSTFGITADYQAGIATTTTGVRDLFLSARDALMVVVPR